MKATTPLKATESCLTDVYRRLHTQAHPRDCNFRGGERVLRLDRLCLCVRSAQAVTYLEPNQALFIRTRKWQTSPSKFARMVPTESTAT